jgi:hypothetical protein
MQLQDHPGALIERSLRRTGRGPLAARTCVQFRHRGTAAVPHDRLRDRSVHVECSGPLGDATEIEAKVSDGATSEAWTSACSCPQLPPCPATSLRGCAASIRCAARAIRDALAGDTELVERGWAEGARSSGTFRRTMVRTAIWPCHLTGGLRRVDLVGHQRHDRDRGRFRRQCPHFDCPKPASCTTWRLNSTLCRRCGRAISRSLVARQAYRQIPTPSVSSPRGSLQ